MSTRDGLAFPAICRACQLPAPVPEYQFAISIGRHWRFDWAWVRERVALEIDGGVWIGGRHTSGAGFLEDMKKLNEAAILGWAVLRCPPKAIGTAPLMDTIRRALEAKQHG